MVLRMLLFRKGGTKNWLEAISKVDSSYFQTFSCIYIFALISTFFQKLRSARSPSWGKYWSWKSSKRKLKVVEIECENANSKRIQKFRDPEKSSKKLHFSQTWAQSAGKHNEALKLKLNRITHIINISRQKIWNPKTNSGDQRKISLTQKSSV